MLPILAAATLACGDDAPAPVPAPRFVASFGTWGSDGGEFKHPDPVAIGPDSLLYVGDEGEGRIEVFTLDGDFVRQWPVDISFLAYIDWIVVAPDSTVYVYKTGLGGFGGLGRYTGTGETLSGLGLWIQAGGLEFDALGNLYICGVHIINPNPDPMYHMEEGPYFWKFNPQHELIKKWGYPGPRDTTGWSGGPMTWNDKGNLLVRGALDSTAAVFEFTPDGDPVSVWRIPTPEPRKLRDIACDHAGRIHISSPYESLMYMFDSRGRLLSQWNAVSEEKEPLDVPMGVAVDSNGFLYVADWGRYRVVKYQPSP
jgi:streptogramin lyase